MFGLTEFLNSKMIGGVVCVGLGIKFAHLI